MKTLPILTSMFLWAGLILIAAAQNPQPPDKKESEDKNASPIARVARNMESSEERLKKSDPGDVTRKIQRDIIDGLDELIKQNSQSKGGQGGRADKFSKAGRSSSKDQSGQPQAGQANKGEANNQAGKPSPSGDDMQNAGQAKGGKEDGSEAKSKNKGKGEDKQAQGKGAGQDNKDDKDGKKGSAKADAKDGGKDGSPKGDYGTAKKQNNNKIDLLAEQYRAEWGHLPLTKRLEMDAYAKQRFMPRYDDALQQYYRTISEQSQRKN